MEQSERSLLFWLPRVLGIAFAVLLRLFSLDVLTGWHTLWSRLPEVLIHLLPASTIVLVLTISWRRDWFGAFSFLALGFLYLATGWGQVHWTAFLVISGPLLAVGALFLLAWFKEGT